LPAPGAQLGLQLRIIGGDGENGGAAEGVEGFAEIAGGEQAVLPVVTIEQHDVCVAEELAVLKAVVEEMNSKARIGGVGGFGEKAGVVAVRGYIDRQTGFTGDEKGFIAEVLGGAVGVDAGGEAALAAVASGEYVDLEASLVERFGQCYSQRRFAGAAC
jgi:hypothetical protein